MKQIFVTIITLGIIGSIFNFYRSSSQRTIKSPLISGNAKKVLATRDNLLLPDMKIIPPKELYITVPSAKKKFIRFSTTFANVGKGILEVIGHSDKKLNKTFATQYIKKVDGTGEYKEVGTFIYHPAHSHWHIENYVQYQLWSIKDDAFDKMLANTGKQSFCIWDERAYDLKLPDASPTKVYTSACARNIQGMSIGWSDTYLSKVEGQIIDISNIPDGQYFLRFEVNPDRRILESDYQNNSDWTRIEIKGARLTNLGKK